MKDAAGGHALQSSLSAAGFGAAQVLSLTKILGGLALLVFVLVTGYLLIALFWPRAANAPRHVRDGLVIGLFGAAIPAVILLVVFGLTVHTMVVLASPPGPAAANLEIVGHQWWWEVRYPDRGVVTANEVHIPVGERVDVKVSSADVIHSFWVPSIQSKMDVIPGRVNSTWLLADSAGEYRGQCAEYCGLQHAHMALDVIAEPRDQFDAWLAAQAQPAQQPADQPSSQGLQVFAKTGCINCHTVRLSDLGPGGNVGPDLTHVASRGYIAAGTLKNEPGLLASWVTNTQAVKPGNKMPTMDLSPQDLQAVVAFLDGLK